MANVPQGSGGKDVEATVQKIIADQLKMKPADVRLNALLQNDLGVASLDAMEIILSIEEAFGIDIPDEEARKAKTPGDIVNFIRQQIVQSPGK
jgi:acyl carrier protein